MLRCARERAQRERWMNVELVHADIADYVIPERMNGVFSTGVFGYVTERDAVIERVAHTLVPGGCAAIVDGKRPTAWPEWLFRMFVQVSKPFGLTEAYFDARTWTSIERWFTRTTFQSVYGGLIYIASGAAAVGDVG